MQAEKIARYFDLGLSQVEIGKLIGVKADAVRANLTKMAQCGLVNYTTNPKLSAAGLNGHTKSLAVRHAN